MEFTTALAFLVFAGTMVSTPGPANLLLFAHGAGHGFKKTIPLIAGVTVGKVFITAGMGIGLYELFQAWPQTYEILRWIGMAYILWLSYKIWNLKINISEQSRHKEKPLNFFQGLIVHPLNPKAWVMVTSSYTQYSDPSQPWVAQVLVIIFGFLILEIFAHSFWVASGQGFATFAAGTRYEGWMMRSMAVLMVAAVLWAQINFNN